MISTARRLFLLLVYSAGLLGPITAPAAAYPEKPVHLVVGYSPGGGSDLITRIVGKALSERWRQPVVVDNRVGADGSIAASYVANAQPDGYTSIMVTNSERQLQRRRSVANRGNERRDSAGVRHVIRRDGVGESWQAQGTRRDDEYLK